MTESNDLTSGSVVKTLISFSVPFVIANLIQALYGAVDLMVVGRYCGPESVAAVSTGTQVTQIVTSAITGMTLGSTILIGKYIGMKSVKDARETIGTTLSAFAVFAAILTVLLLAFLNPILRALKTPAEAYSYAVSYVTICIWGIIFICGYNAVSAILRGYGDSRRPMIFVTISCVMNILGDFVLVKYFHMGVRGTAIATIFSQGFSMVCAIWYLNRSGFIFKFTLKNLVIVPAKLKELAVVGIPISLQELMVRLSFLYLTSVTNRLGVFAAAAVGVAGKYDVFAMLPATSVANAMAAITAQNYGAGKPERAKVSLFIGTGAAFCASMIFFLWAQLSPQTMIGVFSTDASIIEAGIPFFKTCSFDYLAVSFVFCMNGYLNGRSETIFTMISCCTGALLLRMPLTYFIYTYYPDSLGMIGMIAPAVSVIMAVYTAAYVFYKMKRDRKLFHSEGGSGCECIEP